MRAALIGLGLLVAACGNTHEPTYGGVAGSRVLQDLSYDEWAGFCGWVEEEAAATPLVYECSGAEIIGTGCESGSMRDCYDWRSSTCLDGPARLGGQRTYWSSIATCRPTVAEWAACMHSLLAPGPCTLSTFDFGTTTPECWHAACRDRDAGVMDAAP